MEEAGGQMCPVCTLFLRPNMTLHEHLFTHPKDQVIEALVRLAVTPNSAATINTNSQFTAITYRQFTTSVPEPMMINPCLVTNNTSTFPSGVIRSSVPILSYPYYPPDHHPSSSCNEQVRVDSNTQCSFSYTTQTTQTTQTNSPLHEVNCEITQQISECNTSFEPTVDPFLSIKSDNHNEAQREQFSSTNIESEHDYRNRVFIDDNCSNPNKSVLEDIQSEANDDFLDEDVHEEVIDSITDDQIGNINDTRISSFENGEVGNSVHELDPFVDNRIRKISHVTMNNYAGNLHKKNQGIHEVERNDTKYVPKSPCLGTVISNTHRLIANDFDHDLRTEEVDDYNENEYGKISPNRIPSSPASEVSNWSAGSGLRVRRDLSNLDDQGSNCVQFVQPNSIASEFVTSDPYNDQEAAAHLTNLDTVMELNYNTDHQLVNIAHIDIDGKEVPPLNIHSDEMMPPRGELSGQESLGATENSVWELNEPELSEADRTERWRLEIGYPSLCCLECDMKFTCVKERRIHVQTVHQTPQHTQVKTEEKPRQQLKKSEIIRIKQERVTIKSESVSKSCTECRIEFQSVKELIKHRRGVHDVKKTCLTCHMVFTTNMLYNEHLSKVHPIECKVCGKFSKTKSAANLHSKCHLKLKPYQCTVCDKSFISRNKLNEHNNSHTGEAPFKCSVCELSFRRHSNLIQHKNSLHLKVKKKIKDYFCHCGEIFHSVKKLAWHKEIHESKPKQCMYCSERYVHATSLTRHIRHAHDSTYLPKPTRSLNTLCPICKITCIRTSLAQHMKIHTGDRPFQCNLCSKVFSTNWNLQMHKWTHASRNSKPFKCKQCKSAFYMLSCYQAHIRSHSNVRPFTCNYCGRQFIRKYNWVRHVKEHETNKSYCCAVCNKTFHRSYYLTEHMRTHTGMKPYTCHICAKTSGTKSNHNKHVRTHHAREPVNTEG